ncbi:sarcosine oxidase subunit gamma [Aquabacter sp. P-9]|uniref:sarcosine oxidase subunit gamma n=1 Tax=Aquabacter sediminis TaxID=3029197 RepID=UPI00237D8300|nr:sarcosine oxidase subunit gamma family protein [Aquabacter sp. P-9]MDE1570617.1 sarcosine oxidase subunit gamma family protein [Aquabacter sp. P-9]
MASISSPAARTPALAPGRLALLAAASIAPLPPAARYVLRLDPTRAASIGSAGGFDLSGPINSCRSTDTGLAARLGPDEWLLIARDADEAAGRAVAGALAGTHHSLVEAGHRNVGIAVAGAQAATVLNAGCALDLSDAAFPAGSATRTLLGKAEIVLLRPGTEHIYRVECWRSFATYVHGFLTEAALEFQAT